MSAAKFSLMSRASLSAAASRLLGTGSGDPPAGDPPATPAPVPSEDPAKTAEPSDEPKGDGGKTEEKSDAGTTTEQSETQTPPDSGTGSAEQSASSAAGAQTVVSAEDAAAVAAEQHRAGRLAEIKRTADVFASAEGQANPMQAAWLLAHGPDASSESIVKSLATLPGAKPGASTAPAGQVIADTNVDLGRGDPQAALNAGGSSAKETDDEWEASRKRVGAMNGATLSRSDGGGYVTASGNPSAPRRTGN